MIGDDTEIPHINRLVVNTMKELEPSSTPNLQGPDEASELKKGPYGDLPATSQSTERWISREIRGEHESSRADKDIW